ncbi:outer membrane protein assembly factor BamA [Sphingomonas mesophila]|uniref:outer membrane protein assembly factor BamA n=1 Tax=Sphingomonas mesophila TaxID=2303576 RepID=UPI001F083547|nr:outer membrane protein assembly factor BamA [Sphingomonas mesophila]
MNSVQIVSRRRTSGWLLVGTVLAGLPVAAMAQDASTAAPAPVAAPQVAPAPVSGSIRSISVRGAQRLEPATVISYSRLQPGESYTAESLDAALKELYATELFADVVITGADTGNLVITVRENPVINRIVLEGNKRIKDDKIQPEIRLAPRQIFTRSKVRGDVDRIIELYKRSGRFAATVEPKVVQLDQNRVDLIFEVNEGPVSKVRAINIVGNEQFDDGRLRKEMYTREAGGIFGILRQNDSYDPDRLAADQQKLRAFYLTQGYADFRVVSALAELTPDRRDFVITYVVEEGPRYKFGAVEIESDLRDLNADTLRPMLPMKSGDWFNATQVEDVVTALSEVAGAQGYAFAEINPGYERDAEKKLMNIRLSVKETPRVYVERIDINGNTVTRDKVIRREFRVNEGDAFNAQRIKRSQDRLQSLGFFQEELEIKQSQGSAPDRVVLAVDVEEKSTGEIQLSAGYSSLERFILSANIAQRNFMGKGQEVNAGVNWSRYSRSVNLGFTEPQLFDKNVLLGADLYRRDYNSFNTIGGERKTTYSQVSTGGGLRLGFPITEFLSAGARYSLVHDELTLDEDRFFSDVNPDADIVDLQCSPAKAGRYLCDEIGDRLTSTLGYSVVFDNRNGIRATRGQRVTLSQDFAGLGGDTKFIRTRFEGTKYFRLPKDFVLSVHGQGGYIHPLQSAPGEGRDAVRLTDRFFGAQMRGFDIRGIGPRIIRQPYDLTGALLDDETGNDAIGGRAFYMGRLELEIPVSANIRSLGLRPSAFIDAGSVFSISKPNLDNFLAVCTPNRPGLDVVFIRPGDASTSCPADIAEAGGPTDQIIDYLKLPGYREQFVGNSASPRLSIGIGVNWNSPFGPLRLDLARALLKQKGDETKIFSFNVGTQF